MSQLGCYPRLNASMMGQFVQNTVSLVGKVGQDAGGVWQMTSGAGTVTLHTDQTQDMSPLVPDAIVEVIGQVIGPNEIVVRCMWSVERVS